MKRYYNYGRQKIYKDDIDAVIKTLKSNFLTAGPKVKQFENKFAKYVGSKYAISCSNGTAALHLAFKAIDLKKNDIIILPSINFIAAANMASQVGAKIFLADVNPITGQMTPQNLLNCIKKNNIKKLKVFCTMYNGGSPQNAENFFKIKKKYNCYLIEDACHALGAKYSIKKNLKVGCCKYSDISTFSFHPVKSITSGEGGMITTNKLKYKKLLEILKNHGIKKNYKKKTNNWAYKISEIGFNYRLSEIHSALGSSQLNKLNSFISSRKKISDIYNKIFQKNELIIKSTQVADQDVQSAWHLYVINIDFSKILITKKNFIQKLYYKGIIVQVHYIPTFLQPKFKKLKGFGEKFNGAINYYKSAISLPIYVDLKKNEVKNIGKIINNIIYNNAKKK